MVSQHLSATNMLIHTTLHVLQPSGAQAALDSSIALFCAATCSQLNVSKSWGFLV